LSWDRKALQMHGFLSDATVRILVDETNSDGEGMPPCG
jgi:hypothetical protein